MSNATMIPSASRTIVQNLKEVVNCSEAEIYAMLKECNMDPSEAVHRLLNQDTFHEVKSKRKKKEETKDGPESMNNYHARSGAGGRNSSSHYTSIDYGSGYGKPIPRKANGMNAIGSSPNRRSTPTMYSEAASIQNKPHSQTTIDKDAPLLLSQPSGFQNNWSNPMIHGQMSMADTVRLGDSPIKPYSITTDANPIEASIPRTKQPPIVLTPQELVDSVAHNEEKSQYSSHNDRIWITHEEISSVDPSAFSILHVDETFKLERDSYLDENQIHGGANEDSRTESNRSESSYDEETEMDNSRDSSDQDDTPLSGIDSYNSHRHEVEDTNFKKSSANANLQQLNLPEENFGTTASTEDKPAVIIPSHLQVTNADLSHLRFGSFGSSINNATPFGSFPSNHQRNNNLDMALVMEENKLDQLINRNTRYYDNDQLKTMVDEKATNTWSYDVPLVTQPEVRDETHGIRGNFSSISDCAFPSTTQPSPTYSYPDLNSQMQNLSPFPMVKSEVLSSPWPTQQTIPNSNIHHPSLTQPMHCSQPSLPSGHFGDMIGYPFLPLGYTNLAPVLQSQAAAAARKYENVLPHYQTGISESNLTQFDAFQLGYGGSTGTINNTLGNFNLNPSTALGCTTVGFADALSLRHKDGSHFIPVQHDDKSATWLKEAGSRGISNIPGSKFYNLQSEQSVIPAFRQAPQQHSPSQYSPMEYLNYHQSQQQNRNMSGSQGRMRQRGC